MARAGLVGGRRFLGAIAGAVALCLVPAMAQDPSSPMQFWLQNAKPSAQPAKPHYPAFRPRNKLAAPALRRAPTVATASPTKSRFVVVVFGDSLGGDLARGLSDAYAGNDGVAVLDATATDGGLVQNAAAAWSGAVEAATGKTGHADAVVIMPGVGDLRTLADAQGAPAPVGSAVWQQLYGARVDQVAAVLRDRHLPVVWVGLPVSRDPDQARAFAALNAVLRERAERTGAPYVDTWEAFTTETGQYDASGPDVNGQTSRLRRADGLHFTRAGARKLAAFVEPEIRREQDRRQAAVQLASLPGDDRSVFDEALQIDVNAQIRHEAGLPPEPGLAPGAPRSYPVVDLSLPPQSGDGRLASLAAPVALPTAVEAVLVRGLAPDPRQGRIDDFTWPAPR